MEVENQRHAHIERDVSHMRLQTLEGELPSSPDDPLFHEMLQGHDD